MNTCPDCNALLLERLNADQHMINPFVPDYQECPACGWRSDEQEEVVDEASEADRPF